jgi:predicted nucleic acid-binding protein
MSERAVVDTSVFAAIVVREAGWRELAQRLAALRTVRTAPFFRFECANVVWKKRRDIGTEVANAALELTWAFPTNDRFELEDARAAVAIGTARGLAFYDSAFLAIARRDDLPLWTLDARQAEAARCERIPLL